MTEHEFQRAFQDHKDAVYGFALRMTGSVQIAEDVAQDCFVELLRRPDRFDPVRGPMRQFLLGMANRLHLVSNTPSIFIIDRDGKVVRRPGRSIPTYYVIGSS